MKVKKYLGKIYHWLRHPGENLSDRVVHGGVWNFLLRFVSRSLRLVRTVVLARLLAPNDFGLFGIAMLALNSLERFSKTGFDQALIQKKEDTGAYLDSAWTIQLIRGTVLGVILFFGAPLVGNFFNEPRATLMVRVLATAEVIKGMRNIGIVYFRKELEFHKLFLYRFSGTFSDFTAALLIAYYFQSVWALVFGILIRNIVQTILSYFIHSYSPSLSLTKKKVKELVSFGKYIFYQSIVIFTLTQGDDAFVGKVLGATALGYYKISYRISNLGATEITHVISSITFPAFSKLQENREKLLAAVKKTLRMVSLVVLPMCAGIFVIAPLLTRVVLSPKWMPIVPALKILCLFGLIRSIGALFGPVYRAVGKPNIPLNFNLVQLAILAVTIYPLSKMWGVAGVAVSTTIAALPILYLTGRYMRKLFDIPIKELYSPLLKPFYATAGMSLIVKLFMVNIPLSGVLLLILTVFMGVVSYLLFLYLFASEYYTEIFDLLAN